jgi:hypothetical protein
VDKSELALQRLFNQHIGGRKFQQPEEVVRWMGAVQAQDYQQALWAIGLRTHAATLADVERAIAAGKILRTWPMRGTLHFIPQEDVKWMLKLSASRMLNRDGRRQAQLELDHEILECCGKLFVEALSGGGRLTRLEMMQLLERENIRTTGQRGYHILWYSAQTGLICLGPMQGKQQTFVLLDEWATHSRDLSREAALEELARRYFFSHGPATLPDFARWAGLPVSEARSGLEAAKPDLTGEKIDGNDYWMGSDAAGSLPHLPSEAYLLPGFDEYLIGYKDRSAVLAEEFVQRVIPGKNGIFQPVVVFAGQVAGVWKRSIKKKSVEVTLMPFTTGGDWEARAAGAARCFSEFLGLPLTSITITP